MKLYVTDLRSKQETELFHNCMPYFLTNKKMFTDLDAVNSEIGFSKKANLC